MEDDNWKDRITTDPETVHGEPTIKGTRITVSTIVGSMADGMSFEDLLEAYPQIDEKDIKACLRYASESARGDLTHELGA